jgi:hypothetical protein
MYILFLVMISGYGFGALTALLDSWERSGRALAAIGTVAGTGAGLMLGMAFRSGSPFSVLLPLLLPVDGRLALRFVGLSAIPAEIYADLRMSQSDGPTYGGEKL